MRITRLLAMVASWTTLVATLSFPQSAPIQPPEAQTPSRDAGSAATGVRNTSYEVAGQRVLRQEGVVHANLGQVWMTCTTAEGMRTYLAPVVEFELKTGGKYETNYHPGSRIGDPGTIHNVVLAYLPQRMLAFKVGLTDRFPAGPREAGTLFAVLEFERLSDQRTKVTISMAGWGTGLDWDSVYTFFDRGNAYTLAALQRRFTNGPMKWEAPARH